MTLHFYKFDEYLKSKLNYDIHPQVSDVNKQIYEATKNKNMNVNINSKTKNIIYYGPDGVGKYSCALDYISKYSQTGLTYEKNMQIETSKGNFTIKISDIHFEIDISVLGCNAKQIWNDIIKHIYDVLSIRKNKNAFILCKNFHEIHSELLDVFYSYMQTTNNSSYLNFILVSNSVSFLPETIINKCVMINVARPTYASYIRLIDSNKTKYSTMFDNLYQQERINKNKMSKTPSTNSVKHETHKHTKNQKIDVSNIENIVYFANGLTNNKQQSIVHVLSSFILQFSKINMSSFVYTDLRDKIYDIYVSNQNAWIITWKILRNLILSNKIPESKYDDVVDETYKYLELFNNNYRPIYHLERYIYFLATTIN